MDDLSLWHSLQSLSWENSKPGIAPVLRDWNSPMHWGASMRLAVGVYMASLLDLLQCVFLVVSL